MTQQTKNRTLTSTDGRGEDPKEIRAFRVDPRPKTKIALVTGGNRGIGFEICRQLARLGMTILLGARDPHKGETAAASLRAEGLAVEFLPLDVTESGSIAQARASVEKRFGRLDVLVNNAAILIDEDSTVLTVTEEQLRNTLEANLFGPFHLTQAFLPLMLKNGFGRVVNISSEMGGLERMERHNTVSYRISKTALNALTRVTADLVKEYDIKVNSMCPGWVMTDMGGPGATRTTRQGADTAVWLSTLPADGPNGGFFQDRQALAW